MPEFKKRVDGNVSPASASPSKGSAGSETGRSLNKVPDDHANNEPMMPEKVKPPLLKWTSMVQVTRPGLL